MNDITLIAKNLLAKKSRAILLTFSIMVAFLIFGALGAIYTAWNSGTDQAADNRLITSNRINVTVSMPLAYRNRTAGVEGVSNVTHASWFGGYFQDPTNIVQSFAVDAETYLLAYPELVMPDDQRAAFINTRDCLLVGVDLAIENGWQIGDHIPLLSNIWMKTDGSSSWDFDICAIFDGDRAEVPANYVMMHYDYYNEALAFNVNAISWMIVNTDDADLNDQVMRDIDDLFANSPIETDTVTEAAFNEAFAQQFGNIAMILLGVVGAAFATILMIVGTTMVMAVQERTKEIAVMKTLGFRAPRIFTMVLSESVLLSVFGGLLGMGLATIGLAAVADAAAMFMPGLSMPLEVFVISLGLMVGLGLITGLIPAINAHNVRITDALNKQ